MTNFEKEQWKLGDILIDGWYDYEYVWKIIRLDNKFITIKLIKSNNNNLDIGTEIYVEIKNICNSSIKPTCRLLTPLEKIKYL